MLKKQKIKYLEGLRGVAAMVVVIGHLYLASFLTEVRQFHMRVYDSGLPGVLKAGIVNITQLAVDGELAVWIFWLLSSYVISILFFKPQESYDKVVVGYFSKRYFRLAIPVFGSVMFAYILMAAGLMYNRELAAVRGFPYYQGWLDMYYTFEPGFFDAIRSALYDSFLRFRSETSYNAVLWTIQNEFLGSLFTFSIFGVIRHNSKRFILYLAILLVLLTLQLFWLAAFVVGHVLCDYDFTFTASQNRLLDRVKALEEKVHGFTALVFITSILFVVYSPQIMSLLHVPIGCRKFIISFVVVYTCMRNNFYKRIFSSTVAFWLGRLSFSLYLVHLPIICSLTCYLVLQNQSLSARIMASLLTLVVVVAFSYVFMRYVDDKSIIYANRIGEYFKKYTS